MLRMVGKNQYDDIVPVVDENLCVPRGTESEGEKDDYYKEFPIVAVNSRSITIQVGSTSQKIARVLIRSFWEDEVESDDWMFVETPEAVAMKESLQRA